PDRSTDPATKSPARAGLFLFRDARRLLDLDRRVVAIIRLRDLDLYLVGIDAGATVDAAQHQVREGDDQRHHDDLDADEWHGTPIDLPGGDPRRQLAGNPVEEILLGRDAAQIEQGEAEGRVH